ncbi:MAG: multicopper oxidase domain-containing protein [Gammaproteobacteria bacterium]|nr:multicopper oxidase domain-containing protein [Gammaproteobacteria bacterium]
MMLTRRKFLRSVGAGGIALVAPLGIASVAAAVDTSAWFRNPLRIPAMDEGRIIDGKRVFDLAMQYGTSHFINNLATPTAGINGSYLGPVLKVKRGEDVHLKVTNRLSEPSTLHWHGLNLPAIMDGGPHQVIPMGTTWEPRFNIRQPAATQWYHAHMYHRTGIQVYHGLAGLLYIDDDELHDLQLPSEYGVDDIPLVLQDRAFNQDGSLRYMGSMHDRMIGMMGPVMLVNGTAFASFKVQKPLTRLRLLNGSNARIYNLGLEDRREFLQIATDGGLLAQPVAMRNLVLAPGERCEILVEFKPGEDILLWHSPLPRRSRSSGPGMMGMMGMMAGNDRPFPIMRFDASQSPAMTRKIPAQLLEPRSWSTTEAVRNRRINLDMGMGMGMGGGFRINGKAMDINRIDFRVRLGEIEIWEIGNSSPMAHPFHIHDTQFRILDRDGKPPGAGEQGLKDTVLVYSGERVRIITQFEHYADARAPYMFHCHILEHEDAGMMGQFVVVA